MNHETNVLLDRRTKILESVANYPQCKIWRNHNLNSIFGRSISENVCENINRRVFHKMHNLTNVIKWAIIDLMERNNDE